ncbi:hypothetical protein AMECASPLE_038007 [Ameca splendens]|uniref:Secreted protein n=1 Tax=Ameca splendens TaxID=208324 RepID=A0ABV0YJT5_9TELE
MLQISITYLTFLLLSEIISSSCLRFKSCSRLIAQTIGHHCIPPSTHEASLPLRKSANAGLRLPRMMSQGCYRGRLTSNPSLNRFFHRPHADGKKTSTPALELFC